MCRNSERHLFAGYIITGNLSIKKNHRKDPGNHLSDYIFSIFVVLSFATVTITDGG